MSPFFLTPWIRRRILQENSYRKRLEVELNECKRFQQSSLNTPNQNREGEAVKVD